MESRERIIDVVYEALDEVNRTRPRARALVKDPRTVLIGDDSSLDSLTLTAFIIAMEEKLERTYGETIGLVDVIGFEGGRLTIADLAGRLSIVVEGEARR